MSRSTSFGEMATAELEGRKAEVMRFDEPGSSHTHNLFEHAYCLEGDGWVEVDGEKIRIRGGELLTIEPGLPHRMVPTEPPYFFTIFYSGYRQIRRRTRPAGEW